MAERKLKIRNYRNVGVEEQQSLLLNTTVEKGEMGSLVLIVGPNNCGKSNLLDALTGFGSNAISTKDIPDFNNENPLPEITFLINDDDISLGMSKKLTSNGLSNSFFYDSKTKVLLKVSEEAKDFAVKTITLLVKNNQIHRIKPDLRGRAQEIVTSQKVEMDYDLVKHAHQVCSTLWGRRYYIEALNLNLTDEKAMALVEEFNDDQTEKKLKLWEKKHDLSVVPNIVKFSESVTSHSQLTVSPENIDNSPFFKLLFSAIDYQIISLSNCYKKVREQKLNGLLRKTEKEINQKLEDVTRQFNKLFFLNSIKYRFEITLETSSIYLSIFMGDTPLHLDKQSAGFRWFFNFYFTVISHSNLHRGDIVVMDEPATNLHMQGIQELRSFIKEYARKSELTFVVSTHLPFFVDVDYLEEIRVVHRIGEGAVIENKFHAIDGQETDALKPIKTALTVGRYVLYDQANIQTIFVEGLTDYCYLTGFKKLLKIDNVVFLPVQGVKKPNIVDTILKVEKNPKFLVDGDHAGEKFKEENKMIEITSLSDINKNWKTIEDLFSANDKQKSKSFLDCVSFKHRISRGSISKETKENFQFLLENITV